MLKAREDFLNGFKSNLFPIMSNTTSDTKSDTTSDITFDSTPDTTPDTTSRHIRSEIFIIYWAFIKLIEKIEKKQ